MMFAAASAIAGALWFYFSHGFEQVPVAGRPERLGVQRLSAPEIPFVGAGQVSLAHPARAGGSGVRGSYALAVLASDPYLYFRMRGTGGIVEDVSGNARHGVMQSQTSVGEGKAFSELRQARAFDRESRFVTTGSALSELPRKLRAGFTFEAIVRSTARKSESGALFAALNGLDMGVGDQTALQVTIREQPWHYLRLHVRDSEGSSASAFMEATDGEAGVVDLFDGLPHHVIAIYDGSEFPTTTSFQIVLDGQVQPMKLHMEGPPDGLNHFSDFTPDRPRFGAAGRNEPKLFFAGSLEEIAIYNRALGEGEVKAHYDEFLRWR